MVCEEPFNDLAKQYILRRLRAMSISHFEFGSVLLLWNHDIRDPSGSLATAYLC